jgi:hypothetical protein
MHDILSKWKIMPGARVVITRRKNANFELLAAFLLIFKCKKPVGFLTGFFTFLNFNDKLRPACLHARNMDSENTQPS